MSTKIAPTDIVALFPISEKDMPKISTASTAKSSGLSVVTFYIPFLSTSASFLSSAAIMKSIMTSRVKFTVPYRRIVFGMSAMDLLTSVAWMVWIMDINGLFLVPFYQSYCDLSGFVGHAGIVGSAMYTMALSIYYHCVVVNQMWYDEFRKRVEIYLHIIAISYSLAVCLPVLHGSMNMNIGYGNTTCIITYEQDCVDVDSEAYENCDIENKKDVQADMIAFVIVPIFITLTLVTIVMINLACATARDEAAIRSLMTPTMEDDRNANDCARLYCACKRTASFFQRLWSAIVGNGSSTGADRNHDPGAQDSNATYEQSNSSSDRETDSIPQHSNNTHAVYRRDPVSLRIASERRQKDVISQARLYIFGYIFTQSFWLIEYCLFLRGHLNEHPIVDALAFCLSSLQGLVNIFVYTRPHVRSRRREYPEQSWLSAFFHTLATGGDHDDVNKWQQQPRRAFRLSTMMRSARAFPRIPRRQQSSREERLRLLGGGIATRARASREEEQEHLGRELEEDPETDPEPSPEQQEG